jgi:hypothetical protein
LLLQIYFRKNTFLKHITFQGVQYQFIIMHSSKNIFWNKIILKQEWSQCEYFVFYNLLLSLFFLKMWRWRWLDNFSFEIPDFDGCSLKISGRCQRFIIEGPTLLTSSVIKTFVEIDRKFTVVDADAYRGIRAQNE